MNDKRYLHELERHMSILTAPNYNLNLILQNSLIGHSNKSILKYSQAKIKGKSNKKKNSYRDKERFISNEELKFLEVKNSDKSFEKKIVENTNNNDKLKVSEFSLFDINNNEESQTNTEKNEFATSNRNCSQRNINKYNKEDLDFNPSSLSINLHVKNLQKIKRIIGKEIKNLDSITSKLSDEVEGVNKKCHTVALEKIELIEENENLDLELNNIFKQKIEINKSNNTCSTDGNQTSDPSTRESKSGGSPFNTAPNKSLDTSKLKKIEDLNEMLKTLKESIIAAKEKADKRKIKNEELIKNNKELKKKVDQKTLVYNQLKAEYSYMKNKVEEKKAKESTPRKLLNKLTSIKNIFK